MEEMQTEEVNCESRRSASLKYSEEEAKAALGLKDVDHRKLSLPATYQVH